MNEHEASIVKTMWIVVAVVAIAVACAEIFGQDLITREAALSAIESVESATPPTANKRLWSDDSPWNQDRSEQPVAEQSESWAAMLDAEGAFTSDPTMFTLVTEHAPAGTPLVPVRVSGNVSWLDPLDSSAHRSGYGRGKLSAPLTADMKPSPSDPQYGDDRWLAVHYRGVIYEFWRFGWDANGNAYCTNATWQLADGYGAATKSTPPNVGLNSYATNGAGFPLSAGIVHLWELEQGHIDHCLSFGCRSVGPEFYPPASKSDGTRPGGIPEGVFFRVPIDYPTDGLTADQLTLLKCLQTYGGFVGNYSGRPKFFIGADCAGRVQADTLSFLRGRNVVFLDPERN